MTSSSYPKDKEQIRFISDILKKRKYKGVSHQDFFRSILDDKPVFMEGYRVDDGVYGKKLPLHFVIFHRYLHPNCVCIQSRWQSSGGSVHEKYPYWVMSIARGQYKTIIVLDGEGYDKKAERWLRNQSGKNNLLHVFNQKEFSNFSNNGGI